MHFDDSFFEDEVREGFYVCSMMKRYWAAQMEVMQTIIDICHNYDIRIFADCGTLLGAVRHKGFVPWDDDIDMSIMRSDVKRFVEIMKLELPEGWVLLEPDDDRLLEPWYRIVNSTGLFTDNENLTRFHGCKLPVGVDVFIFDYMPPTEEFIALRPVFLLMDYVCFSEEKNEDKREMSIKGIEEALNRTFPRDDINETKRSVLKVYLGLLAGYTALDSDFLIKTDGSEYASFRYDPRWFDDVRWLPFENMYVPVPVEYEKVLTARYGDYMVQEVGVAGHDYPVYKSMQKKFDQVTGVESEYKPDKDVMLTFGSRKYKKQSERVVFFLPYSTAGWKYMEPIWKESAKDSSNHVYVMPIPYFKKHYTGELMEQIYDLSGYPDYVQIINLEDLNIEDYNIDEIYVQQPYDERNLAMSVHPYFYSPHLREMCKQLIYVPDFELREFASRKSPIYKTFENFVSMPGVVYADKTLVQSENMRQKYVDYLCEWMGDETRDFWLEKIVVKNDQMTALE